MDRQGGRSPASRWALLALLCVGSLAASYASGAPPHRWPVEMLADAELADVFFLDRRHGWAVGDRGVIRHTDDGGENWHLQPTPVACRLESACFVDEQRGWAVGGYARPYTHRSVGVVLRTDDGGRRWTQVNAQSLPGLKRVKFFDAARGWAVGNASAMYPSGVFYTKDGGHSWTPVASSAKPLESIPGWPTADFRDERTGAAAGSSGALALVRRKGIQLARNPGFGLRRLRCLRLVDSGGGWLVGDGGLAMTTVDGGLTWQRPGGRLPSWVERQLDFTAVACGGDHCWIAGYPGTCVFHSADRGRSWSTYRTGQNLSILGLSFVDAQHGWAVGAMGTILATRDGGRSWQRQHSGGTRAALVGFYTRPADVPLELLAQVSAADGYLSAVEVLTRPDVDAVRDVETAWNERTHDALIAVGSSSGHTAWRFPIRPAALRLSGEAIVGHWRRRGDRPGIEQLEEEIVRKIRVWRPEVILTHGRSASGADPATDLVRKTVLAAVEKAADPTLYTDQLTAIGLRPWRIKVVYGTTSETTSSTAGLSTAQLVPRLGRSLAAQGNLARQLLHDDYRPPPASIGWQILTDHRPAQSQTARRGHLLSGVRLHPGGEARRSLGSPAADNLDGLRRLARQRSNIEQILARVRNNQQGESAWLGQISDLLRDRDDRSAAEILYQLAWRFHHTGHPDLAAQTWELLIDRLPDDPLAEPALVHLIQFYSSSESAWLRKANQRVVVQQVSSQQPLGPTSPTSDTDQVPADRLTAGGQPVAALRAATLVQRAQGQVKTNLPAAMGTARTVALAEQFEADRPALFAQPAVRFPLATAAKAQGHSGVADRIYHNLASSSVHPAWRACAAGEHWLTNPRGLPPKRVWRCALATERPRLDGHLDDAIWRNAKHVELKSTLHDDGPWPAIAMLARDEQYLYFAVRCSRAPEATYVVGDGPRSYDADLRRHDRIDLLLDLDRDFATFYRISVDHRGRTGDACVGDKSWNPQWYVAAATERDSWTVEAAIPLDALSQRPPTSGDVWAVGVQRTVPGAGFQSWTRPASVEVSPKGFGYLVFE